MAQYNYQSGTASQFMVQESNRVDREDAGSGNGSGTNRSPVTRNLTPIHIRVLLQYRDEDGPLYINGKEVSLVVLVGQIRSVEVRETCTTYILEDHTGRIEVLDWHQEDSLDHPHRPANNDTIVRVVGVFRPGREQPSVTAYRLSPVMNKAEVDYHHLEVTVLPLRLQKMQAVAASLAHASFTGQSLLGVRGLPNQSVFQTRFESITPSNSGDWGQRHGPLHMGPSPAFGAVVTNHSLRNIAPNHNPKGFSSQNVLPRMMNNTFRPIMPNTPTMQPEAVELLNLIKNGGGQMGPSRKELRSRVRAPARLETLLDFLAEEGHIYTTSDQDHFKATDA